MFRVGVGEFLDFVVVGWFFDLVFFWGEVGMGAGNRERGRERE